MILRTPSCAYELSRKSIGLFFVYTPLLEENKNTACILWCFPILRGLLIHFFFFIIIFHHYYTNTNDNKNNNNGKWNKELLLFYLILFYLIIISSRCSRRWILTRDPCRLSSASATGNTQIHGRCICTFQASVYPFFAPTRTSVRTVVNFLDANNAEQGAAPEGHHCRQGTVRHLARD